MTRREEKLERILKDVCNYYRIEIGEIKGKSRLQPIVAARHTFCYLARRYSPSSLNEIGSVVNRSHSNVISSIESVKQMSMLYKEVRDDLAYITEDESIYKSNERLYE